MPYQRKNKDLITISPTVDRILYTAIQARGYSISEIINMAFSAVLEIDDEYQVQFEVLKEARNRLEAEYYRDMREKAKDKLEEKKRRDAEAAAKKALHDKLLNIVIDTFRPATPEKIQALEHEFQEKRWDAASFDYLRRRVEQYFKDTEYKVDINMALDLVKDAISCKWTTNKINQNDFE